MWRGWSGTEGKEDTLSSAKCINVGVSVGIGTGNAGLLDGIMTWRPMYFGVMQKINGVHGRGPMGLSHDEWKGGKMHTQRRDSRRCVCTVEPIMMTCSMRVSPACCSRDQWGVTQTRGDVSYSPCKAKRSKQHGEAVRCWPGYQLGCRSGYQSGWKLGARSGSRSG
jgi:hypothetical protein